MSSAENQKFIIQIVEEIQKSPNFVVVYTKQNDKGDRVGSYAKSDEELLRLTTSCVLSYASRKNITIEDAVMQIVVLAKRRFSHKVTLYDASTENQN